MDRARLPSCSPPRRRASRGADLRSRGLFERAGRGPARRGADEVDVALGAGGFPLYLARRGREGVDVDGHDYVDFCLGDTGAMAGHSPAPTVEAVQDRLERARRRDRDAADRGRGLGRRASSAAASAGRWQFTLTATDANRWAIRLGRQSPAGARSWCSTGATTAPSTRRSSMLEATARAARGQRRPAGRTDGDARGGRLQRRARRSERSSRTGDIACVLAEPALTNIGIVLPEPGFWAGVREQHARPGRC